LRPGTPSPLTPTPTYPVFKRKESSAGVKRSESGLCTCNVKPYVPITTQLKLWPGRSIIPPNPRLRNPPILLRQNPLLPLPIHQILHPKVKVAASLERAAQLKSPWHPTLTEEKIRHLEDIAYDPIEQYAQSEAAAAAGFGVLPDLRQGEDRFDAEGCVALEGCVGRAGRAYQELEDGQESGECGEGLPVGPAGAPLPEAVGAGAGGVGIGSEGFVEALLLRGAVQEGDVQEEQLDKDHDARLD
jgi:hypothetical protein